MSISKENNILKIEELPLSLELRSANWQTQGNPECNKFLEALPIAVWVVDANGHYHYANPMAQQILGDIQAITASLSQWSQEGRMRLAGSSQNYPYEQFPLVRALQGNTVMVNDIEFHGVDQKIPLEMWAAPVFDKNLVIQYAIAVFQETSQCQPDHCRVAPSPKVVNSWVSKQELWQLEEQLQQERLRRQSVETALQQAQQELENLATLDNLTQLPNRRRLNEYLTQEWRRLTREKVPLSLILCTIDFFDDYKNTYGAKAGDSCLQQVAQAIGRAAKRPSDMVGRYGDNEFATILPNTDADGAVQVASAMRWELKLLRIVHSQSTVNRYLTLSVGVSSVIPTQTSNSDILVTTAFSALEEAKQQGRNRVIFKAAESG